MKATRLRGLGDIVYILSLALVIAIIVGFLMQHLHTRHEMFAAARERSLSAYHVRKLKEVSRHLQLEERIREAEVRRDDAPDEAIHAPADRTVRMHLPTPMGRGVDAPTDHDMNDDGKREGTP